VAQELDQRWLDPGVPELRAEVCQVQSTQEETSLLFGTLPAGGEARARLERRVLLSPGVAKQLAAALAQVLRDHERRHGGENATPAGTIESPPGDAEAPAPARPLLARVRALGAGFGFEKSFKLSAAGLQDERMILGVRTRLVDAPALAGVCRGIGMPEEYLAHFERALPQANTAGFGFEGDAQGGTFKVYLEFWERLWQRVQRAPANRAPEELFLGFKWQARDPTRRALARYTCHPLLPIPAIRRRLEALYEGGEQPSLTAARELLALAARRVGGDSFVYVEAAEEGNPRKSFDLNLYKARLTVGELQPALAALARGYGISIDILEGAMATAGGRTFGHLSGGLGRDGRDFLTVYYELEGL
jgi:hypothetical protein